MREVEEKVNRDLYIRERFEREEQQISELRKDVKLLKRANQQGNETLHQISETVSP